MAAKAGKKVIKRRRERKVVEKGAAHIRSSFNNTMVTMVLLKEERICAAPFSTTLRSLRRLTTFLVAFAMLHIPPYFFLLAMVFLGPLRVRALVLVRWP